MSPYIPASEPRRATSATETNIDNPATASLLESGSSSKPAAAKDELEVSSAENAGGEKTMSKSTNDHSVPGPPNNTEAAGITDRTAALSLSIPTTPTTPRIPVAYHEDVGSPSPPPPPPKDEPRAKVVVTSEEDPEKAALKEQDAELDSDNAVKPAVASEEPDDDSRSEIQSIMEQFEDGTKAPGADEIMSPRIELAGPFLGSPVGHHPPRKSSLEPLRSSSQTSLASHSVNSPPPRSSSLTSGPAPGLGIELNTAKELPESPSSPQSTRLPPLVPPKPDPDSDLPFDFHRFLEQLRHRTADPVAKFLRSFLLEFGKKQWMVHEQVKIISDFLEFITKKMAQCEVWRTVSDAEFDNACEGMEKLVMNRLYSQTFSPAIPPPEPLAALAKGRRRQGPPPSGRRGQHQEDVERDDVLAQKVRIYSWVKENHLDIKPLTDKGKKFLALAQHELLKINNYRAPRDKVICILNSCKVIFGFLRNAQHDQSADSFVPLLIYTVLRANPRNLVSNVQYILRFRNANKLTGEAGYYVSSLGGAIDFIERLDRTSLTISDAEFEQNVEAAVSQIAEGHPPEQSRPPQLAVPDKGTVSRAEVSPRNSADFDNPARIRNGNKSESDGEENAAVAGLLRTIQRPLSTIGRIFSDDSSSAQNHSQPPPTPQPILTQRLSPLPRGSTEAAPSRNQTTATAATAEDRAARQASKEAEQARSIREREEGHVVETLCGMFPALDREVVVDVVRANEGRIGSAVDACLALST